MVRQKSLLFVATLILATVAVAAWSQAQPGHGSPGGASDHGAGQTEAHPAEAPAGHPEGQAESHPGAEGHPGEHEGPAHLANWLSVILAGFFADEHGQLTPTGQLLLRFQDPIFSGVSAILLALFFAWIYKRRSERPGRLQMAVELMLGGLFNLFQIILGPTARRFTPYLGTLFLFILFNNLIGLVPLMHSSTSAINTTLALAICTFCLVQWVGIKENGILGYLHHMAGSPRSAMDWGFSLLLFPLHVLGEFIKPISLSLRLFGNIFGEDVLIATMVVLGAGLFAGTHVPVGLPFQLPFIFLAMLTSTIQALVFALLSTVYIALMLPHEDHQEAHGH